LDIPSENLQRKVSTGNLNLFIPWCTNREVTMANRSTHTFKKREREEAKRRKRLAKEAKKLERKELKDNKESTEGIEDPDIAGIIPGPQPHPEE
jgi:rubrerythrin